MNQNTLAGTLKALLALFFVALLALSSFGLGVSVGTHAAGQAGDGSAQAVASPGLTGANQVQQGSDEAALIDDSLVREAWSLLQKQYYGDLPEGKEITYDAIRGIVERLGDKHTAFLDPENAVISNQMMEGHFEGIGAQVGEAEGGGVLLDYLYPGQPADRSGLLVGDVIIAVDGTDVTTMSLTDAISLIRGPEGTRVTLTVRRDEQPAFEVTVTRARIEIPIVKKDRLADSRVAYIALSEFNSVAPGRLADALREAVDSKPAGIILDLRGNPGGFLDAAVRIGSYFVPEGPVLIERFKDGSEHVYQRQGSYMLGDTPLVVLVDGGSASASEIVAGAIQDSGTGVLIGEKTYGKGSVQLVNALSDGSQLRVTVARWFTPKNRGIHETGLEPDIVVPLTNEDANAKRDPQLDRAVAWLLGDHSVYPTPTPTATVAPRPSGTPQPNSTPSFRW